jgi:hypothetical protein
MRRRRKECTRCFYLEPVIDFFLVSFIRGKTYMLSTVEDVIGICLGIYG